MKRTVLRSVSGSRMKRWSCGGTGIRAVNVLAVALVGQPQRDGEAQIGNEGKRMRRIDRQRRQHRKNLLAELRRPDIRGRVGRVRRRSTTLMPASRNSACSVAQIVCWSAISSRGRLVDLRKLLGRRQAVGAGRGDAGAHHAHQAGHAHHVEFVQVGGGDRQKAHPLEQGMAAVLRLLDHPAVEGQPGQFAVDEALRRRRIDRRCDRAFLGREDLDRASGAACRENYLAFCHDLGFGGFIAALGMELHAIVEEIGKSVMTQIPSNRIARRKALKCQSALE